MNLYRARCWRLPVLVAGVLALSPASRAEQTASLPPTVVAALAAARIPRSNIGVVVMAASAGAPLLTVNAQQAMNPASTMKLLTTFAALDVLGPGYQFRTEARLNAPVNHGVLQGDLYLKGGGDPKLDIEKFWLLLRRLRAQGIQDIRGDLVLDRSRFITVPDDPAAFDGKPLRAYNVSPDPLLLAYKALRIDFFPAERTPLIAIDPLFADTEIVNHVRMAGGACTDWRDRLRAQLSKQGGKNQLLIDGEYPASCGEKTWNVALHGGHGEFVHAVFTQLWREMGGKFHGRLREGAAPEEARLVATIESPPVAELVRDINKFSNNVMARELFYALAVGQPRADIAAARAQLAAWLKGQNLSFPELVVDNGAGLSRSERIAPLNLALLLRLAWTSPLMAEFVSSLPLSAVDGTMKSRVADAPRRMHIKTGTLDGVKTVAGYVRDVMGHDWIVVFFINHERAQFGGEAQDALLDWVAQGGGQASTLASRQGRGQ